MAAFNAIAKFTSSVDGKSFIIQDISDYENNDEGYTRDSFVERKIEIRFADSNTVAVIDFPYLLEGVDAVSYEIDTDKWLDVTVVLKLNPAIIADTFYYFHKKIGYNQILRYKQSLLIENKTCTCDKTVIELNKKIEAFIIQAKFYARSGDGLGFNKYIDATNLLIKNPC